jgi:hypothetical protein
VSWVSLVLERRGSGAGICLSLDTECKSRWTRKGLWLRVHGCRESRLASPETLIDFLKVTQQAAVSSSPL